MTLQEDMDSKLSWTQAEIDGLKQKYRRTHFDQFVVPRKLKRARRKIVRGVTYVWMFGAWRPQTGPEVKRG